MTDELYQPALYDMYIIELISELVGKMISQNHDREMIISVVTKRVGSEYKKQIEKNIEVWKHNGRISN